MKTQSNSNTENQDRELKIRTSVKGGGMGNRCETTKAEEKSGELKIRTSVKGGGMGNRCEAFLRRN